jgi:hypothetical protein
LRTLLAEFLPKKGFVKYESLSRSAAGIIGISVSETKIIDSKGNMKIIKQDSFGLGVTLGVSITRGEISEKFFTRGSEKMVAPPLSISFGFGPFSADLNLNYKNDISNTYGGGISKGRYGIYAPLIPINTKERSYNLYEYFGLNDY